MAADCSTDRLPERSAASSALISATRRCNFCCVVCGRPGVASAACKAASSCSNAAIWCARFVAVIECSSRSCLYLYRNVQRRRLRPTTIGAANARMTDVGPHANPEGGRAVEEEYFLRNRDRKKERPLRQSRRNGRTFA
jgi:hypothetical protein